MSLKLYNTLTRKKELFTPITPGKVGLYSCGPTVYHYAHIGNLMSYVFADTLKKVLEYNGLKVNHVINITDVGHLTSDGDEGEDKLEKGAKREGKSVWDIAKFYTDAFMKDISLLNIASPTTWCKATDHIQEQIDQVKIIEKKGYTYKTSDGIYFDTSKLDDYGKLARLKVEDLQAGARVDIGEKHNKTDFALWKFSPTNEKRAMEWESPWGVGFPGWHIECSAMSSKYLGKHFDIHTGGIDHIPVHHTNEIAQSEVAFGKPWVNIWMHNEFLIMDSGKMSKSSGEFLTLQALIDKGYKPLHFRYFLYTAIYRQQLTFNFEALDSAKNSYDRLKNIIKELKQKSGEDNPELVVKYEEEFHNAINDDLNMPQAMATLWNVLRDNDLSSKDKLGLCELFDKVLSLDLLKEEKLEVPQEVIDLAKERLKAKIAKDWNKADELRDKIKELGFLIKDKKVEGKETYEFEKV